MATKQFYATGSFKYATRMMRAGDPVEMDGPTARLYTALGKISPRKPTAARQAPPAATAEPATAPTQAAAPAAKRTTRKRATKKAK